MSLLIQDVNIISTAPWQDEFSENYLKLSLRDLTPQDLVFARTGLLIVKC